MGKTLKIILTVVGLLIIGLAFLLVIGFYSMDIEDMYGDNQDIFYSSRQGDFVVNHDTKELGQISKTWTRFFVINQTDTLNINDWWDDKSIEILRLADKDLSVDNLSYENIERLTSDKRLKLVKKLR